ncbi:hypothetical protein SUGI_0336500 [Cryptomeria japonica]|uniref:leucine-rich repeat receptor protein kinase HPCA1 isoform X2 n=1 Tax=Cryptomeria japonica TaxID=3369 RepID=UPI002408A7A8|nr:leucine-rich repeat receptor protein kinase HPCA1 isoform X2 [Cryptomeria japonica]GLJ18839.1 hypothetical protein SUGI_0336500 [Cryptomeria japonica]
MASASYSSLFFLLYSSLFILLYTVVFLCPEAAALSKTLDVQMLMAVKSKWQNTPPTWEGSDPCSSQWNGLVCTASRITSLTLSSMNLSGTLATEIGFLNGLQSLDLSYNKELIGPIPSTLGNLINLESLVLIGCGFTGHIPHELGNLQKLTFLDLSSNNFSGPIPPSVGNLTKLRLLDLAKNQLSGSLPVSSLNGSGLDRLINAQHFHLNSNGLSGSIPADIFHSDMQLIHVLFDSNALVGEIPLTFGHVPTLEVIRLDGNFLEGPIPSNIGKLKNVNELHLSNNNLSGTIPDLSGMNRLQYIDLSNNSFEASEALEWFGSLEQLTTLILENGSLIGPVPSKLFCLPQLETVRLRNNDLNGTLKVDTKGSSQLQLIDLENNLITGLSVTGETYTNLMLSGNPACDKNSELVNSKACQAETTEFFYAAGSKTCGDKTCSRDFSANPDICGDKTCREDFRVNPETCECAVPYEGKLEFRAPSFSDLSNVSRVEKLKNSLCTQLNFSEGAVSICCMSFDSHYYLNIGVQLFPFGNKPFFERAEIIRIGFALSNKIYNPPDEFGTFSFTAISYYFTDPRESKGLSSEAKFGISSVAAVLALVIAGVGGYAFRQKWRAEKAIKLSKPFASWRGDSPESKRPPKVDGVRCFSFRELNRCTNYFSEDHKIGSGGYGMVYRGTLNDVSQVVAIKRAKKGSLQVQGAAEFKNEIEVLSRIHHKNLVKLTGFCFGDGEQMLVYEYMPNGSLADYLSEKSGKQLDWRKRIVIALGAARGLTYLHEYANPPIIHRDVKSSNILLDENFNAKVSDFGLSKLSVYGKEIGHMTVSAKGTPGYMDPEFFTTYELSEKSDVYSFGVVLLEIITAKGVFEDGQHIVQTVKKKLEEKGQMREVMDPFLRGESCMGFESFLNMAMRCVEESAARRPVMSDVVRDLESILTALH